MRTRCACLVILAGCTSTATAPELTPVHVILDDAVHFNTGEAAPGIYSVERGEGGTLRLVPEDGAAMLVPARVGRHEESGTPAAYVLGGDAATARHVVLLLDGGVCLEVVGFIGGVRPRAGIRFYSTRKKAPLKHALASAAVAPKVEVARGWKVGTKQTIRWSGVGVAHERVTLTLYRGKRFVRTIQTRARNTGKLDWMVPDVAAAKDYSVLVTGRPNKAARTVPRAFSALFSIG